MPKRVPGRSVITGVAIARRPVARTGCVYQSSTSSQALAGVDDGRRQVQEVAMSRNRLTLPWIS